jgi:hypothetical protein
VRAKLEKEKKVRRRIEKEEAKKLSKRYKEQSCYLLLIYDPQAGAPIDVIPVRTQPTLKAVLKNLQESGLYPLIHPQRVYVPKPFWEEYRLTRSSSQKLELVRKYGLLKDSSIYRFDTVVIDIDSPFESVYPAWEELKERLNLNFGYQVYRTKSGRFRAYIYLLKGTKDLRRAKELVAIIYAFFESKGLNADETFVYRLNHPVFYEEFPLYSYELVEDIEGGVPFFRLYRKAKELQKEHKLYTFKGRNLTEEIWGKKPPARKKKKRSCRLIKAPAFVRKLREGVLDNLELWKGAVISLSRKHDSYRYTYVIQPAVGWAKYLELPEVESTEFLVGLLGEEKRKDVEKAWRYARELEFTVPESVKWAGKTREEWEGEALAYLRFKREVSRQELLKEVFANQKWLCDLIMDGLVSKGMVAFQFVVHGRGRPRKVYQLADELRVPLRKAVGWDWEVQASLGLSSSSGSNQEFVVDDEDDFSQDNNFLSERAMGGGWYLTRVEREGEREREYGRRDKGGRRRKRGDAGKVEISGVDSSRVCLDTCSCPSSSSGSGSSCACSSGSSSECECWESSELVELLEAGLIDF